MDASNVLPEGVVESDQSTHRLTPLVTVGVVSIAIVGAISFWATRPSESSVLYTPDPFRIGLNAPFIKSSDAVVDEMIRLADLSADDLVYDLGCGDGRMATYIAKLGAKVIGVDVSSLLLKVANIRSEQNETSSHAVFCLMDAARLGCKADLFDVVWICNVLATRSSPLVSLSRR